ncbi:hypothetical protein EVAR_5492_1 [Eumeta japonica]|uniref:Uncharacterized protein n=1 Tax=Eumeta variegata TaxID=151549 RepID=A0A4C1T8T5_EUMVA|nr:hypothetical protein EVAR_5492_1 [Eumeta japonica]
MSPIQLLLLRARLSLDNGYRDVSLIRSENDVTSMRNSHDSYVHANDMEPRGCTDDNRSRNIALPWQQ